LHAESVSETKEWQMTADRDKAALGRVLWRKVCFNIDGMALGATICALAEKGIMAELAGTAEPLSVDGLATRYGARRGFLHLAVRLLASQGLVKRSGGGETARVSLSEEGRAWLPFLAAYDGFPGLLTAAIALLAGNADEDACELWETALHRLSASLPGAGETMGERVRLHVTGPLVAVALRRLTGNDTQNKGALPQPCWQALEAQGWAEEGAEGFILSGEGEMALDMAAQYFLPLSYLPTFSRVPKMLFGDMPPVLERDASGSERHLDRALDIEASGAVFTRVCAGPFLELALPLFDREELAAQPGYVIDTGCGNGTLLKELFHAIASRTRRGKALSEFPLVMVGTEYNPVASQTARAALEAEGIPHLVVAGDVGDPDGLGKTLAGHGIDARQALHVGKSVIHNRRYQAPRDATAARQREPGPPGVFVDEEGGLIEPGDMAQNLVEHFRAWLPWTRRHGMLVIEAHTVAPEVAAARVGNHHMAYLDASHGFSCQYLMEAGPYRDLAREAGFIALSSHDFITGLVGRPLLSLDYFMPADVFGLEGLL
jgi:hypothetical protein